MHPAPQPFLSNVSPSLLQMDSLFCQHTCHVLKYPLLDWVKCLAWLHFYITFPVLPTTQSTLLWKPHSHKLSFSHDTNQIKSNQNTLHISLHHFHILYRNCTCTGESWCNLRVWLYSTALALPIIWTKTMLLLIPQFIGLCHKASHSQAVYRVRVIWATCTQLESLQVLWWPDGAQPEPQLACVLSQMLKTAKIQNLSCSLHSRSEAS